VKIQRSQISHIFNESLSFTSKHVNDVLITRNISVQTVSDICLKRTRLLDTSAFSALEVLDDNHAL